MASSSHILVIDDDQLILNLAVRVLGGLDYQVSTATTAEIGLELPEQNTFDLIILDLVMQEWVVCIFLMAYQRVRNHPLL